MAAYTDVKREEVAETFSGGLTIGNICPMSAPHLLCVDMLSLIFSSHQKVSERDKA